MSKLAAHRADPDSHLVVVAGWLEALADGDRFGVRAAMGLI
jgi:hypothetical protein